MKTELKTAEQHLKDAWANQNPIKGIWESSLEAIESHTSERLDHLRQRLEAKQEQLYTKHGNLFSAGQDSAFEEAISLIDQLKQK